MLPPLPRCSGWAYSSLISPSRISLPRKGCRVGLHIVLFEACSAFTRVAACTLARSPVRDPLPEGFRHFVTSMPASVASGWSDCRMGLAPTGKAPPCHGARGCRAFRRARFTTRCHNVDPVEIGLDLGDGLAKNVLRTRVSDRKSSCVRASDRPLRCYSFAAPRLRHEE